ncbi:amino acid transporter [Hyphopichia burtonii NRRL Y-1933]|uniref:Amino acid transporter n=1 Tax=Hyphopichia burtonii NRRL Y-1933 TaxID=984485 RepID=A0A1E4RCU7_9ASCO|nr:amino acid transporter [Hyphopichia burtonii NRRL Y-1933]ODV65056.1 amino acid transporter [Hyphopichia burtonii NRRL Y-1933]
MSDLVKSGSGAANEKAVGTVTLIQIEESSGGLVKRFSLWNTVALQVSLICSPIALGTFLSTVVGIGGSPGLLYGFILAVSLDLVICFSLAELASRWPNSAAQVHWTNVLAPTKYRRGLSFTTGVLSCAAWIFACFTTCYTLSMFVISLIELHNSGYIAQDWHYYLIYAAFVLTACAVNAFAVNCLPVLTYVSAAIINAGTLYILITLLVRTPNKQSNQVVWKDFINESGWSSNGVAFFLGLLPSISCVTLFEGPSHQTDEIPDPSRNVPLVMTIANSFLAIFAFISGIIYMYCVSNPNNLLTPIGGEPIVQLLLDSLNSLPLTTAGVFFLIATFYLSLIGYVLSTSRLFWAFANSEGLPWGKSFFGKIHPFWKVPINSLVLVLLILLILGCMIFGSSTALSAVLSSSMVCVNLSYIVPISLLLYRSKLSTSVYARFSDQYGGAIPYFNLGRFGMPLNIIAVCWGCFIMVWLNFPLYYPVTSSNMNYACAVLGITFLIALIIWFTHARKHFEHNSDLKHI